MPSAARCTPRKSASGIPVQSSPTSKPNGSLHVSLLLGVLLPFGGTTTRSQETNVAVGKTPQAHYKYAQGHNRRIKPPIPPIPFTNTTPKPPTAASCRPFHKSQRPRSQTQPPANLHEKGPSSRFELSVARKTGRTPPVLRASKT